ncbi:MAG: hydroxyethylthiazole kinase [Lachnospiraceae bacterium]|nr:hydroxyethylthiazole kinase [Lachnospiraceae bacterium]
MLDSYLRNVKTKKPVIHCITNYVTANDCANILLASGALPAMADSPLEAAEFTEKADGLCLNLGTLSEDKKKAMLLAGKKANEIGIPVTLDPVGVGTSEFRSKTAGELLKEIKIAVIRGNASEIKSLLKKDTLGRGVDAESSDEDRLETLEEKVDIAKELSKNTGAVVVMTGEADVVTDGVKTYVAHNGIPELTKVTGAGCMLSSVVAAFAAANKNDLLTSALAAVCTFGYAGEIAKDKLNEDEGNISLRNYLIDAIYLMTPENLEKGAKYEDR